MSAKEAIKELLDALAEIDVEDDKTAYQELLLLLDNMYYHLRCDLQIDFPTSDFEFLGEGQEGEFDF